MTAANASTSTDIATITDRVGREQLAVHFDTLTEACNDAGKCLRIATLCLRTAFTTAAPSVEEFNQLRRSLVNDANVYRVQVLPIALESTTCVNTFMNYFVEMELDDVLAISDELYCHLP